MKFIGISSRFTKKGVLFSTLPLVLVGVLLVSFSAKGLLLQAREVKLADPRAGQVTTYQLNFETMSSTNIGSVRIQFCSNDPLIDQPCTAPVGFDATSVSLANQTGMTGFAVSGLSTANVIILTRTSSPASPQASSYTFDNIQNQSTNGSAFVRIQTYTSEDASGGDVDYGGLAINISDSLTVSTRVPPYLLFCVGNTIQAYDCSTASGTYIDFGDFSPSKTSTGNTQLLTATNAEFGLTVRTLGTTLTSGTNVIPALASPDVSRRGVSQFGFNLRSNSSPPSGIEPAGPGTASPTAGYGTSDFYKFVPGDVILSNNSTDEYKLTTVNYVVNVSSSQAPGIYVTSLMYVALASF